MKYNEEQAEARLLECVWVLDEHGTPRHPASMEDWARSLGNEDSARTVGFDVTSRGTLSTVFIGIDISGRVDRLFETALFTKGDVEILSRYGSLEEAKAGHAYHLARLNK